VHPKANMSCPVSFRWWGSGERAGGSLDQVDDNRMRRAARADRGDCLLLAHAHARCAAWPAGWVAALTPLSVDGMIVAASTTLLADSRSGGRGGVLPWALLVAGSLASLAANVAIAEPTAMGRVIAAWPSFALIAAYELLMRQIRHTATGGAGLPAPETVPRTLSNGIVGGRGGTRPDCSGPRDSAVMLPQAGISSGRRGNGRRPTGRVTDRFRVAGRSAVSMAVTSGGGRLVKRSGSAGDFVTGSEPALRVVRHQVRSEAGL
jgi:hypothetical protein